MNSVHSIVWIVMPVARMGHMTCRDEPRWGSLSETLDVCVFISHGLSIRIMWILVRGYDYDGFIELFCLMMTSTEYELYGYLRGTIIPAGTNDNNAMWNRCTSQKYLTSSTFASVRAIVLCWSGSMYVDHSHFGFSHWHVVSEFVFNEQHRNYINHGVDKVIHPSSFPS